MQREPLPLKM